MFAERWGEDVKWDFQQDSAILHAPQLEFNGERWAAFQVDDLIILIREEAIENHFAPLPFTLLSIEEAHPLLERMGLEENVRGWIIHGYFEGRDIIILNFEAICEDGLKKGDLAVIKKGIIRIMAHEVRHSIQFRDQIYRPKGFRQWRWRLHGWLNQIILRFLKTTPLKTTPLYFLAAISPLVVIGLLLAGHFLLAAPFNIIFFAFGLGAWTLCLSLVSMNEFWSPWERDARRYAEEAQNDNQWSEFIGVFRATDIKIEMAVGNGAEAKK